MKIKLFTPLISVLFIMVAASLNAQSKESITGKWKTIDDETGKAKSVVELSIRNGKLYGKVVEILNPEKRNMLCDKCDGKKKNQKVLGMEMVWNLEWDEDDKEWEDGVILDPNKGTEYDCKMWMNPGKPDVLYVRGYVAFFFRTQNWYRQP